MTEKQHIGNNVKRIISESKYSSKEIAEKIGVSYQYLYKIYNNKNVDSEYLIQLAQILDVPISVFFGELHSKLNTELLESIEKLHEYIKSLKHKLYIIESINFGIKGFYISKFKTLNDSTIKEIESNTQYMAIDSLIHAGLDAILNMDKDPDKLTEYYSLLRRITESELSQQVINKYFTDGSNPQIKKSK